MTYRRQRVGCATSDTFVQQKTNSNIGNNRKQFGRRVSDTWTHLRQAAEFKVTTWWLHAGFSVTLCQPLHASRSHRVNRCTLHGHTVSTAALEALSPACDLSITPTVPNGSCQDKQKAGLPMVSVTVARCFTSHTFSLCNGG